MPRGVPNTKNTRGKVTTGSSDTPPVEMTAPTLGGEMDQLVNGPSDEWEGAPYYDPTLNFLHWKFEQAELENMRCLDKIDKETIRSKMLQKEMRTISSLMERELQNKEIVNPNTGEKIENTREQFATA